MTVKGSKVRDYTTGGDDLQVEVVHGEVYEALAGLYAIPDCVDEGTEYDDEGFIERLMGRLDDDLRSRVVGLEDSWSVYFGLLGVAYDRDLGTSMPDFLAHLRTLDPMDVRRLIVSAAHVPNPDPELAEAAAAGDPDAVESLLSTKHHVGLKQLLLEEPAASVTRLIDDIEGFYTQGMKPEIDSIAATLERDADEKRALAKTLPADAFVEKATRGVTFEPSVGVGGVVLIPSMVIRPWTLMVEHGSLRMFVYSIPETAINADPAEPPAYVLEMYKALADERRLRVLAELWMGETDLKTLAQRLDLAKSTTHHHLRVLRTAGLVRVILRGDDKVYGLRKEALTDAGPLLEGFLNRLQPEE